MAIIAALGAGLGLLQMGMQVSQRKAEIAFQKTMKAVNDKATLTSWGNAQARARAAKYDSRAEARGAYADIIKRRMQNEGRARVQAAITGITGTSITDTLLSIQRGEQEAFLTVEQGLEENTKAIDNQMRKGSEQVDQALRSGQVLDLSTDFGDALSMGTAALHGWAQFGGSFSPTPTVGASWLTGRADTSTDGSTSYTSTGNPFGR